MFKYLEVNFIFFIFFLNDELLIGDDNSYINDFFNLFIFPNLWYFSKSSIRTFNHVLVIDHIWRCTSIKIFYILGTSPRTHCRIISLNFFLNGRILGF